MAHWAFAAAVSFVGLVAEADAAVAQSVAAVELPFTGVSSGCARFGYSSIEPRTTATFCDDGSWGVRSYRATAPAGLAMTHDAGLLSVTLPDTSGWSCQTTFVTVGGGPGAQGVVPAGTVANVLASASGSILLQPYRHWSTWDCTDSANPTWTPGDPRLEPRQVLDGHADLEIDVLSGSDRIGRVGHDVELRLRLTVPTGEVIQRTLSEPIVVRAPVANKPIDVLVSVGPTGRGAGVLSSAWWAGHEGTGGGPGGWTVTKPEVTGRHDLRFAGDSRYIRYTCTGTGACGRPPNGRQLHSMAGLQGWWWHKRTTWLALFGTGPSHDCDSDGWTYFASVGGSWVRLTNTDDCRLFLASDTRSWFTAEQSEDVDGILRVEAGLVGGDAQSGWRFPLPGQNPSAGALDPSLDTLVTCGVTDPAAYPSQAAGYTCFTDADGEFVIRYRVPVSAANQLRGRRNVLRIYVDYDQDGTLDHAPGQPGHEPSGTIGLPIAKAVNYVALGDSYSSGEAGDKPDLGTYQSGISDADAECRRWDQAHPYIFNRDFLNNSQSAADGTFKTFACTGAITLNIYDPADPDGDSLEQDHAATNRPSPTAPRVAPLRDVSGQIVLHRESGWEQRQGASLADVEAMRDVDMVTLTIGGNDAGFAAKIQNCALVNECDPTVSDERLAQIEQSVVDVLARVREIASDAAVFVLGYPYLTPEVDPCGNPREIRRRPSGGEPQVIELDFSGLPDGCEARWNMYFEAVDTCDALSATGVVRGSIFYIGALFQAVMGGDRTRIDYREAKAMWLMADALNARLRSAAGRAGVHFVDVVGGVPLEDAPKGFVGHSSCSREDLWLNGFVVKSSRSLSLDGSDASSFHPTAAGQTAYADLLEEYIRIQIEAGAGLNAAGLPVVPVTVGDASSGASTRLAGLSGAAGARGAKESSSAQERATVPVAASVGLLVASPATAVSGCGAPFVSPGEQVTLSASGFAADAAVSFAVRALSLGGTQLTEPQVAAATADSAGAIAAVWAVPAAPAASVDAAPRAFIVDAAGPNASGGTHSARMGLPLVAYPATAPCAHDDAAATTLGTSVRVAVLANDTAPTGGSLDAASVRVRAAHGGSFAVDTTTGAVTFTPDAGFWGTVVTSYVVYDSWGIGVEAALTVTVDAGCTITGTVGETAITGTDGDDVICVPDPGDRRAFHVIDAKGGNDIVLGGAGVEWIYGGEGADVVYGRGGGDRIVAGAGADIVYGGLGFDHIYSVDLADTVVDEEGGYEMVVAPSVVVAQSGPEAADDWAWVDVSSSLDLDVLANDYDRGGDLGAASLEVIRSPGAGTATVADTGDGRMVIAYTAAAEGGTDSFSYRVCDALGECSSAEVTVMVGTAGCTIVGTAASETLYGTPGDDVICGGDGDDIIYGLGGDDILVGGAGADRLFGDAGDDLLFGGVGADSLWGGPDDDVLWGGDGGDTLEGNRGADRLYGGHGDDTAHGGLGGDVLFGGAGVDRVFGGEGDDRVHGGAGDDLVRGGEQADTLYGGPGDDTLIGWTGADRLWGGVGRDSLQGDAGDDALWGGPGNDTLRGNGHDDQLHGGTGDDTLRGGDGADRLWGGAGDDTLYGGEGTDYLNGGADTDTCSRGETTAGCENESRHP